MVMQLHPRRQHGRQVLMAALMLLAFQTTPSKAEIGVSLTFDQPGFFGRIDLGGAPAPEVIYEQPVIVEHVRVVQRPIYLRVPPGHVTHWRDHCHEYQACARRVYFVREQWYEDVYVPAKRRHHEENEHYHRDSQYQGDGHSQRVYEQKSPDKYGAKGNDHGGKGNHGKGNGHGKGKGHGHDD